MTAAMPMNQKPRIQIVPDNQSGIGRRIGRLVSVAVITSCFIVAALLSIFGFARAVENMRDEVRGTAVVIAQAISTPMSANDINQTRATLSSVSRLPGIAAAIARSTSKETIAIMGSAAFLEGRVVTVDSSLLEITVNRTFAISVPVVKGGREIGDLVVLSDIRNLFWTFLLNILIAIAAACTAGAIGLLISRKLQRRIVDPIVKMTSTIREIRRNRDYLARVDQSAKDETGMLAESFNALMSDIKSRDAILEKMAYFDNLTGLRNRAGCQQSVDEMSSTGSGAVLLFDIDGFRETNDTLGHTMGNSVLMDVAARLHETAGVKAQPARTGGDEFCVVINGVANADAAMAQAARYIAAFYEPLQILAHEIDITLSCGIALCPAHGETSSDLLRRADLALVEAKKLGRGRTVIFAPAMEEKIHERNELISGLRAGLPNKEIIAFFQPQVNLHTGKTYGFEALARWSHPVRGNISPAVFIPVAEHAGLIPEIGKEILRQSCAQAVAWFRHGKGPYQVSVNVSAAQLVQAEFLRDVQEILSDTGLPPPLLCLELTESVFLGRSVGQVRHMFNDLKKMGIELALDDFGTGYSSLSYLEALPFDKVKIDRAFVNGVQHSAKKLALLKNIISLSHSLEMKVVAEGAETREDINALLALNADAVQGYYFAKPASADQALLRAEEIDAASFTTQGDSAQTGLRVIATG